MPATSLLQRILFWSPRLLCIFFAVFLSLFALDVFQEGAGFWVTSLAFIIHLAPAALVVIALAVAWRHEIVGAVTFLAFGLVYLVGTWRHNHWSALVMISGPLFLVGCLFLASWVLTRRATSTTGTTTAQP